MNVSKIFKVIVGKPCFILNVTKVTSISGSERNKIMCMGIHTVTYSHAKLHQFSLSNFKLLQDPVSFLFQRISASIVTAILNLERKQNNVHNTHIVTYAHKKLSLTWVKWF